jgi:hypothetical protein
MTFVARACSALGRHANELATVVIEPVRSTQP